MLSLLLVLISAGVLIAIVVRPRLSVLFIWPIILLYPNNLWNQARIIPLEIGFDDLYIIVAFVLVFWHRRILHGRRSYLGFPVWAAFAFVLIVVISNISGTLQIARDPAVDRSTLKDVLKMALIVPFVYSIANAIDDWKDLKRLILVISIALGLAAALTVVSHFQPHIVEYFWEARAKVRLHGGFYSRATGSFMQANTVGIVMSIGIVINLVCLLLFRRPSVRGCLIVGAALMFAALLLSKSRTGLICLGAGFLVLLGMRGRAVALLAVVAVIPVVLFFPDTLASIAERFELSYSAATGQLGPSVEGRLVLHGLYLSELDGPALAFGRGVYPGRVMTGTLQKPHNGFLDLLCYYGVFGVTWLGVVVCCTCHRLRVLLNAHSTEAAQVGRMVILMLVVFTVGSFAADTFTNIFVLYFFFAALILVDSAYRLAGSCVEDIHASPLPAPRTGHVGSQ